MLDRRQTTNDSADKRPYRQTTDRQTNRSDNKAGDGSGFGKAHTGALSRSTLQRVALACLFASFEWFVQGTHRGAFALYASALRAILFLNSNALGKMLSFALKKTDFGVKLEK